MKTIEQQLSETAAERDRLKEENEKLREVMATVYSTMKNAGLNTGHWKTHVESMKDVLAGREPKLQSLNKELVEAAKYAVQQIKKHDKTGAQFAACQELESVLQKAKDL